jgi:hypothetical protein
MMAPLTAMRLGTRALCPLALIQIKAAAVEHLTLPCDKRYILNIAFASQIEYEIE